LKRVAIIEFADNGRVLTVYIVAGSDSDQALVEMGACAHYKPQCMGMAPKALQEKAAMTPLQSIRKFCLTIRRPPGRRARMAVFAKNPPLACRLKRQPE
jgi:hypothetical protein